MSSLYKLANDYEELLQRLFDDEIPDETIADTLDAIAAAIEDKCDAIAVIMAEIQKDVDGIDKEIKRLQARKEALSKRHERLKAYVLQTLQKIGTKKIQTQLFTFSRQTAGQRSLILTVAADDLPEEFKKTTVTVAADNAAIKLAMKAHGVEEIEGVGYLAPATEFVKIK